MHRTLRIGVPLLLAGTLLAPSLALAQATADSSTSAVTQTPQGPVHLDTSAAATVGETKAMTRAKSNADTEIDRRVSVLNAILARTAAMQAVTDDFKQSISTAVKAQIDALNMLKSKTDADTEAAVLKSDIGTITTAYRVFALVVPQARIAAAADREVTIARMMTTLGSKLQARTAQLQSAGGDIGTITTVLADMSAKLSDASAQAQAAVSVSAALTPDQGNKTKMASNAAALKTARADVAAARQDLKDARKDIAAVLKALRTAEAEASATGGTATP